MSTQPQVFLVQIQHLLKLLTTSFSYKIRRLPQNAQEYLDERVIKKVRKEKESRVMGHSPCN